MLAPPPARRCHGRHGVTRFGGLDHASGYDNRSRHRKVDFSGSWCWHRQQCGHSAQAGTSLLSSKRCRGPISHVRFHGESWRTSGRAADIAKMARLTPSRHSTSCFKGYRESLLPSPLGPLRSCRQVHPWQRFAGPWPRKHPVDQLTSKGDPQESGKSRGIAVRPKPPGRSDRKASATFAVQDAGEHRRGGKIRKA
jgi:hypothetical protein